MATDAVFFVGVVVDIVFDTIFYGGIIILYYELKYHVVVLKL